MFYIWQNANFVYKTSVCIKDQCFVSDRSLLLWVLQFKYSSNNVKLKRSKNLMNYQVIKAKLLDLVNNPVQIQHTK